MKRELFGAALALLLLAGCGARIAMPTLSTPEPAPTPRLEVACGTWSPFADDGCREVTVLWRDAAGESAFTFDLAATTADETAPALILERTPDLRAFDVPSRLVNESADREFLLSLIGPESFLPIDDAAPEQLAFESYLVLHVDGAAAASYYFCADGRLTRLNDDGAAQASISREDFAHVLALDYKYIADPDELGGWPDEFWLAQIGMDYGAVVPDEIGERMEALAPRPFPENYVLCIAWENGHLDMDRTQAKELLAALFGGSAEHPAHPELTVAPWDAQTPQEGVLLTEYLDTTYTTQLWQGDGPVMAQRFFLTVDGTLLRLPAGAHGEHFVHNPALLRIVPSWDRAAMAESAFSWDTITALLK